MRKDTSFQLRCSSEELSSWRESARASHLSVSDWIRGMLYNRMPPPDVMTGQGPKKPGSDITKPKKAANVVDMTLPDPPAGDKSLARVCQSLGHQRWLGRPGEVWCSRCGGQVE